MNSKYILIFLITIIHTHHLRRDHQNFLRILSSSTTASGANTISSDASYSNKTYSSTTSYQVALLIKNSSTVTLSNCTISKSGDVNSSDIESAEFYGINSALLAQNGTTVTITDTTITTSAYGGNAVFSYGTNSSITISDSTITSTAKGSARGLMATYSGSVSGTNMYINTTCGSCATLATDRGEGTVTCYNCSLYTSGSGSPIIYSTGDIAINNSNGTATGAQMIVVEGSNLANVTDNSNLIGYAKGNRDSQADQCGIMIYQSQSGDAAEGTSYFYASDSTFSISSSSSYYDSAPFIFVTNTDAVINMENNNISYGSGIFLKAEGTSEWGTSGSNGANVNITFIGQSVSGDFYVDNISTLYVFLTEGSYLNGSINKENNSTDVNVYIDSSSTWVLTNNSYATVVNNGNLTEGDYSVSDPSGSSSSSSSNSSSTNSSSSSSSGSSSSGSSSSGSSGSSSVETSTDNAKFLGINYFISFLMFVFVIA